MCMSQVTNDLKSSQQHGGMSDLCNTAKLVLVQDKSMHLKYIQASCYQSPKSAPKDALLPLTELKILLSQLPDELDVTSPSS